MRLEHYSQHQLKKEITTIVDKHLSVDRYRLFFFGSRVVNRGSQHTDIDIGIEGAGPIPFSTLRRIREDIEELRTLYSIDFIDFGAVSPEFRAVAMQYVEHFT